MESGWCKLKRLRAAPMMKTKLRYYYGEGSEEIYF